MRALVRPIVFSSSRISSRSSPSSLSGSSERYYAQQRTLQKIEEQKALQEAEEAKRQRRIETVKRFVVHLDTLMVYVIKGVHSTWQKRSFEI